ncbi:CDC14A [Cordylochernes scorpioides]|uniref:CDC14A n=1 Tax=Cordylochernes scorpioides TaxID=51811 RepID=A0ABY6LRT2_9ARAC|nr:CDC14A [Cordylochernes scorpioides]
MMKHYRFTAAECIAWIRICRPGSIIGHQQEWLESKQSYLFLQGDIQIAANSVNNNTPKSLKMKADTQRVHRILSRVDQIQLDEEEQNKSTNQNNINIFGNNNSPEESITQGDKLNRIKALRRHPRSFTTGAVDVQQVKCQSFGHVADDSHQPSYMSPQKSMRVASQHSDSRDNLNPSIQRASGSPNKRRAWRHVVATQSSRTSGNQNLLPYDLRPTPPSSLCGASRHLL